MEGAIGFSFFNLNFNISLYAFTIKGRMVPRFYSASLFFSQGQFYDTVLTQWWSREGESRAKWVINLLLLEIRKTDFLAKEILRGSLTVRLFFFFFAFKSRQELYNEYTLFFL